MPTATAGTVQCDDVGRGHPVLLVHGVAFGPASFAGTADALLGHARVIVVHRRGYGRTAARAGGGPRLVEAHTYRMQAHTNADDDTRYREGTEVDPWRERDPLLRAEAHLKRRRVLTKARKEAIDARAEEVAAAMRAGVNAETDPDPSELFAHVYASPTPQLAEQAAFLADELSREGN